MLNEESYYDILGVDEDATASEIRRAFLEWSRKFHPDKHPQASTAEKKEFTEAFQRINQAYEVLRDHREDYDYERKFYGAKSHSETPRQESGFPYYSKAKKKEDSQPSSAKKEAPSSGNTQKEENARNANARAKKTDSKQQSRAKPQKTPKTPPRSRDQEPAFGTRADGQPCKRCQMYGKFCFQHQYQDPRFYNRSPKDSESNKDEKEREKPSPSGADSDSSEEHAFGKRADGQPCKRCQLQGKFCFQHVHQDSRFQKESRDDFPRCNKKERSKSSPSSAGYGSSKRHTFGTRADGQPCKRCQMQGKFCFQHVHQDPQFADKGAKESTNKKSKASPFTNNARKQHIFGTRADGQQCKRCQVQGKFCFQHAHQDPTFHDKKEEHGESMNGH
jgi:curved DNA-binding protein CbpA